MEPLKRYSALIELSRGHHGSLSLRVRLLRTPDQSHQAELESHFVEPGPHFLEEKTMFTPYWDKIDPALRQRFEGDHAKLRVVMVHPEYMNESWDEEFAVTLHGHACFEEHKLFPAIEPFLPLPENV